MNRAKSIKDIGNIYREMQKQAISKNQSSAIVEESAKVKAQPPKGTFPKAKDSVKEAKTLKKTGPKNVKGLKKPKKNKKFSQKTKKIHNEDINNSMSIFDKLYEDVMKNDELDLNTGIGMGPEGDMGDTDVLDIETDVDSDETPETPKEMLQKAIDLLQQVADSMGEEETDTDSDLEDLGIDDEKKDEDEECEDEDEEHEDEDEECGDDEEPMKEATDIKPLGSSAGHQLQKGGLAAGNIKATTGKAKAEVTDEVGTETGKHPMDHKSELSNPSKNKVGSLKTGKSLFDQ